MRIAALVVSAIVAFAACGASDGDASQEPAPTATAVATVPIPTQPPQTAEPTPAPPQPSPTPEPGPAKLEPLADGPYGVGATTVTVGADTDRPLTVEVWFPVDTGLSAEPARYTFITGDYYESPRALVAGPDELAAGGPYPLVVYSHGSGGTRYIHSDYTETLASHGHVVAAPDHTGNTAVEQFLGTEDDRDVVALNRPADVVAVIDAMTDPADAGAGGFAAAVDAERIAVTGHSFGGFATYATVSGYENSAGAVPPDDRVDAIIPIAPAVGGRSGPALLTDDQLAAVDVPALVVAGTDDKTTPVEPNLERAWEQTSSSPHYRLELVAAEHQSFTDVCDYLAAWEAGQQVSAPVLGIVESFAVAGCAEGDMPTDRVQELTNTFAVRFLSSVFEGTPMIAPVETDGVEDIIYAAK